MTDRISGTGGNITAWAELWRATINNDLIEDISSQLYGGNVSMNRDRTVTTQATFELRDAAVVNPYVDFLAVFQNIAYEDGREPERHQLGLFTIPVPSGSRTTRIAQGTYTGYDISSLLQKRAFTDTYNIAGGTNYRTAVMAILALAGISRVDIDATTKTLADPRTYSIGDGYLDAVNELLNAIGYFNLAATPDGKALSRPSMDVRFVEPYRVIRDEDLMSAVDSQPTDTSVANIVMVIQDNNLDTPLTAIRRNDAPDSPTSTISLGPITRVERQSNLADQAAVDALADRLLSEGRTFYQTASLRLLPDPRVLLPGQTVDFEFTGKLAIYNGRWRVRTATIGFDPATAGPVLEVNRVTDAIRGAII